MLSHKGFQQRNNMRLVLRHLENGNSFVFGGMEVAMDEDYRPGIMTEEVRGDGISKFLYRLGSELAWKLIVDYAHNLTEEQACEFETVFSDQLHEQHGLPKVVR